MGFLKDHIGPNTVCCLLGIHADDTVIYFSYFSPGLFKQVLQNDRPNYVEQWLASNMRLVLDQSKTICMLFGTRQLKT